MAFRILQAVFGDEGDGFGPFTEAGSVSAVSGACQPPAAASRRSENRTFALTPFQEAAAARVRRALDRRGGVFLADAVGLGKTYMSLGVIEERLREGYDVLVIVPAALRTVWSGPLGRIARAGRPRSWRILSHTQLSRGVAISHAAGPRLIVVDEAHRFRNPETLRYRALAQLAAAPPRPELLLVTATPVNNALADLYHLVRLFLPDEGLRDVGVPSVRAVFDADPPDPAGLRTLVRELVVRRSRPMVERRYGTIQGLRGTTAAGRASGTVGATAPAGRAGADVRFPDRAPPRIHRYRDPTVGARVAVIEALELTAYGSAAAPLVRLGLLKRMDSSPAAFAMSLRRLRGYLDAFVEAAGDGRLLRPADRTLPGDRDPLQLPLLGIVAETAPGDVDLAALAASAAADLRAVESLIRDLPGSGSKAEALTELLESVAGDRVLVFTEYRDTAESLWRSLAGRFRVARIDGSGAWLGAHPAGRRTVVGRFAPLANDRAPAPERERVDILIATDVLSEGLNLQDARHVVSYDLPWNPVRLLQRIGRVDRLGSPHDEIVPHLFVPADGLDAILGLTRRLRTKLHGISTVLDEPHADDLLKGLAAGGAGRVDAAIRAAEDHHGGDPWERLRTLWLTAGTGSGRLSGDSTPDGQRLWAELSAGAEDDEEPTVSSQLWAVVLVADPASRRADNPDLRLLEVDADGEARPLDSDGADLLARAFSGQCRGTSSGVNRSASPPPGLGPILKAVDRYQGVLAARGRAPAALSARYPAIRLVRRIRSLMADAGAGLSPSVVRDAERVLRTLADPLSPAAEQEVARILDGRADGDPGGGDPSDADPGFSDPRALVSAATEALRSCGSTRRPSQAPIDLASTSVRAVLVAHPKRG